MRGDTRSCRVRPPRRGASLLELLATMTAASIVMATAVGLVHRSYALETRSRHAGADERTALRLARLFRADVHTAGTARCAAGADVAWLIVLDGPSTTVTYTATATGLARITAPTDGPPTREDFEFSRGSSWSARCERRLVTLSGTSAAVGSRRPPVVIDVVAALDERPPGADGAAP